MQSEGSAGCLGVQSVGEGSAGCGDVQSVRSTLCGGVQSVGVLFIAVFILVLK